eukprot:5428725-Alexandrium_andersonii.AAC.1
MCALCQSDQRAVQRNALARRTNRVQQPRLGEDGRDAHSERGPAVGCARVCARTCAHAPEACAQWVCVCVHVRARAAARMAQVHTRRAVSTVAHLG